MELLLETSWPDVLTHIQILMQQLFLTSAHHIKPINLHMI